MKRHHNLLLHPAFIASLFILLLNDITLKYEFHNAITGKLSDFCGLFVFSLFWMVLFPRHRKTVAVVTAIVFCWWKSSYSSTFIEAWNAYMPFDITRVVDYSDLSALIVLPLAQKLASSDYDVKTKLRRFLIPLVGCISIFAFCFTSPPRYAAYYAPPNEVRFYGSFETKRSEEEILEKLKQLSITYKKDSLDFYRVGSTYGSEDYVLRVVDSVSGNINWVPVSNSTDSALYVRHRENPFYIIPDYNLDGHQLKNVKIKISTDSKKSTIVHVNTFEWGSKEEFSRKIRKQYKAHFRELFK